MSISYKPAAPCQARAYRQNNHLRRSNFLYLSFNTVSKEHLMQDLSKRVLRIDHIVDIIVKRDKETEVSFQRDKD